MGCFSSSFTNLTNICPIMSTVNKTLGTEIVPSQHVKSLQFPSLHNAACVVSVASFQIKYRIPSFLVSKQFQFLFSCLMWVWPNWGNKNILDLRLFNAIFCKENNHINRIDKYFFCRFYHNGNKFFNGVVIPVAPERYRSFDSLTNELTSIIGKSVTLPNGVRNVYSMDGKKVSTYVFWLSFFKFWYT